MAKPSIALDDYIDPPRQDFEPRPNASQIYGAKHRAAEPLTPSPEVPAASYSYILAIVVTAILIAAGLAILSQGGGKAMVTPTPAPTVEQPTPERPTTPPAPTSAPIAQIEVYDSPDGRVLGPVELTRRVVPVAHYGDGWVQAQVEGSGLVWIRAADMPGLAIVGRDLSIAPTPVPLPPRQPAWSPPAEPAPTVEPTQAPAPTMDAPLRIRAEDDCNAEHGRCTPPCTAEHGRCAPGDK